MSSLERVNHHLHKNIDSTHSKEIYLIKQIGNTMRMMIITRVLTDKNFISLFFPNVKTLTVFVVPLKCTSVKVVTVAPFVHLARKRRKVITVKFIRMKSGNNKKNMWKNCFLRLRSTPFINEEKWTLNHFLVFWRLICRSIGFLFGQNRRFDKN